MASRLAFLLSPLMMLAPPPALADATPQYVLISFDGAHDNAQWARSRALARETGARFTYFLSCVFLLSPETKAAYTPPAPAERHSNVGFGASKADVAERLGNIWGAHLDGHDMSSHGCGHFDGSGWSKRDWRTEFKAFDTIVADAWTINGIAGEPAGWKAFAATVGEGFRAPYLAKGAALDEVLAERGALYDASSVSKGPDLPETHRGLTQFALPTIPEGPSEKRVIAMDYNLFVRHSGGFERRDEDGRFADRTYRAFKAAFDAQYAGKRAPLQIGFHFTLMNGGAYWDALERFAREVCGVADVKCVSYRQYLTDTEAVSSAGG